MVSMGCIKNSAGSLMMSGPLSISTRHRSSSHYYYNVIITSLFILVSLGVQTGFCSSDSSQSQSNTTSSSTSLLNSESQSALALLAQYTKWGANTNPDIGTDASSAAITSLLRHGISREGIDPDVISTDLENYHSHHEYADDGHVVIPEEASSVHGWHSTSGDSHLLHHDYLHHPVEEKEYSYGFWEWLHSDAMSTVVPLILFGVIPILIGLIPFVVIFTNFWFIFHKIHGLHSLFLGLLGSHHDDSSYGSYSSYGWDGWSRG